MSIARSARTLFATSIRPFHLPAARRTRLRKALRYRMRRAKMIIVTFVTIFSTLFTQTGAYTEYYLAVNMPKRVELGAASWDYAIEAAKGFLKAAGVWAANLFVCDPCGDPASTPLSPAGAPYPWQIAVPLGPDTFSSVNMATGNILTAVPIVGWQSLGRPISFALFHNTIGPEPGLNTFLATKWTHSYSRHLEFDEGDDTYTLFTDEGGSVLFTLKDGSTDTYIPPVGLYMYGSLVVDDGEDEVYLTYKNQDVDIFNYYTGHLLKVRDPSGEDNDTIVVYGDITHPFRPTTIMDAAGNTLILDYDDIKIVSVTAPPIETASQTLFRVYTIEHDEDLLRICTARVDEYDAPVFCAEFQSDGDRLVQITGLDIDDGTATPAQRPSYCQMSLMTPN